MPTALVVGAGLAGLSCAFELSDRGVDVNLIEARDVVGGRTSSWNERGMPVESGLHRWLGFYKHLPDLLGRCGVSIDEMLCWEDEIEIITPDGGPRGVIGLAPLFKPGATIGGLVGNNDLIRPKDKVALGLFFARGLFEYATHPENLDRITTRDYALKHGVSEHAIENLLVPLTAGIYFLHPDRYSAFGFFGLLAPGVPRLHRMRIGGFMGGMTDVMCRPMADAIQANGGIVRTGVEATGVIVEEGRVHGVVSGDDEIRADETVIAVSLAPAQSLIRDMLPEIAEAAWFDEMLAMPSMPVATIQFELDRPVTDVDRTTFGPGTVLGSFCEQSRTTFRHADGRLSVILVPPEPFLEMRDDEVLARTIADAARLGFDLEAHMTDYRVVRFPMDFYSLEPGNNLRRPSQPTPVPGLTLAGDYTRQKYLGSMEGAAVSGQLAAEAVLESLAP
ncbi:MAG TPA: FAD-dependent oxidoreductase [Actinomycetota bacterium]|nr:FAD-dependent oxidoreductase [Actinomycetota bacterium]